MKQMLLELMSAMMPAMMPLVWTGGLLAGLSVLLLIFRKDRAAHRASVLTLIIALFFLASQGMGGLLGAQPSINFGDPSQFEFILVPFWQVGLAMLLPGAVTWWLARGRLSAGTRTA